MEIGIDILLELLIQLGGEILIEAGFQKVAGNWDARGRPGPLLASIGYGLLGAAVGGLSLLAFPEHFIESLSWRRVNLIATPVLAGAAMSAVGWLRRRQGKETVRLDHFAYGFIFAFGMALVRYLFAGD